MIVSRTNPFDDVLELAQGREVLPSALSSAEGRDVFLEAAKERAVFSARTTNAAYLQELNDRIERLMEGGFDNDLPQLRSELKEILRDLGYDPETGFPGDEELGIPPAAPGSLRDLSSNRRLDLILHTQENLLRGAAKETRGLERIEQFPAWELLRVESRKVPRGEGGTMSWGRRWIEAGGPPPVIDPETGRTLLIARKDDPVWPALGDPTRFEDALGVSHPPFAFNSGYGWREVPLREWNRLADRGLVRRGGPVLTVEPKPKDSLPALELPKGLDRATLERLRKIATPEYREQVERRLTAA